jgi:hypothetical protein
MSFAKQINPNEPPPQIIEGDDPFNDQSAAADYLADPPPDISKFVEKVRSLLTEKGIPEEEIFYKFGKSVDSLSAMECLEAKDYLSRLRVVSEESKFGPHDLVRVVDPASPYHRYSGLIRSVQGDRIDVYRLSRGMSDAHGKAWDNGVGFNAGQLELRKRAPRKQKIN